VSDFTAPQRTMLCASDPDDVTGTEGCGVELRTGAAYAVARSLERRGYGHVQGPGGPLPGLYWNNADGLIARTDILEETARTERAAAAMERALNAEHRVAHLEKALSVREQDICQTLGIALGYPRFVDDQQNFPGATEAHGVCVGEHVAVSIAMEAARRLTALPSGKAQREAAAKILAKAAGLDPDATDNFEGKNYGRPYWMRYLNTATALYAVFSRERPFAPPHRHLKRGTTYEVIVADARLQQASQFGPVEGDAITIYRGDDGRVWARAQSEFEDGRFEPLISGAET
jgi:hypothetical protein